MNEIKLSTNASTIPLHIKIENQFYIPFQFYYNVF